MDKTTRVDLRVCAFISDESWELLMEASSRVATSFAGGRQELKQLEEQQQETVALRRQPASRYWRQARDLTGSDGRPRVLHATNAETIVRSHL